MCPLGFKLAGNRLRNPPFTPPTYTNAVHLLLVTKISFYFVDELESGDTMTSLISTMWQFLNLFSFRTFIFTDTSVRYKNIWLLSLLELNFAIHILQSMDEDKSIQRCGTLWLDGIWECWSIFSLIAYAVKHIFFDTRLIVYASPWAAIIIFDKLNANGTGHFRRVWVWVNTDLPLPTPPPTPETHHKGILSPNLPSTFPK